MSVEGTACFERFARCCDDGWTLGWHERNSGNLSYRLNEDDLLDCRSDFSLMGSGDHEWHELTEATPGLASEFFMITGAGQYLHNVSTTPKKSVGIVELDEKGTHWRTVWGLEGGRRPTSELDSHLLIHDARKRDSNGADCVVYHAHCPNAIVLSTLIEPDARTWSRILWKHMTETIVVLPQGIGVVPWMVPGGVEIAHVSAELMKRQRVVVWSQHGLISCGADFDDAFGIIHMAEKSAGLYLLAHAATGGAEPARLVSDEQLRAICEAAGIKACEEYLD